MLRKISMTLTCVFLMLLSPPPINNVLFAEQAGAESKREQQLAAEKRKNAAVLSIHETFVNAGAKVALRAASGQELDGIAVGRTLRKLGKTKESLDWILAMIEVHSGHEKSRYYFEKAWLHYKTGNLQQALYDGKLVLKGFTPPKTVASCYYMFGMIDQQMGNHSSSFENFKKAHQIYSEINNLAGQYICITEMATLKILYGDFELGKDLLRQAEQLRKGTGYNKGRIHELYAQIHFMNAEYTEFFQEAEQALRIYNEYSQLDNALWVRILIGFVHAIEGRFDSAYEFAIQNDKDIYKREDLRAWHHNNLTWILMDRCQGADYLDMKEGIRTWMAEQNSAHFLETLLNLVESLECKN